MAQTSNESPRHIVPFQILMLVLSVYVLLALFVTSVCKLSAETQVLLQYIDTAICFVFLGDFFYRLYHAENRLAFMKWGWIDLVSSIPYYGAFRAARIVRIFRILRGVRSAKYIFTFLFKSRAKGTFLAVAISSVVLLILASVAILNVETAPDSNIKTASDALWWAIATMTTVGYGDRYPVTNEGRVVGAALMIMGVGFFGTFTAYVASVFMGGDKAGQDSESELIKEMRLLRERLEGLESKLSSPSVTLPAQFGKPPQPKE